MVETLRYLTLTLCVIWCVSEIVISLSSLRNRSKALPRGQIGLVTSSSQPTKRQMLVGLWYASTPEGQRKCVLVAMPL